MQSVAVKLPFSSEPQLPCPEDLKAIALLLDVDGTILDMASTPDSVVVPRSLRCSLRVLHARSGGALGLVSGRLIRDLDKLFAPLRLPAIGGHGAEMRLSGDHITQTRHDATVDAALRDLIAASMAFDRRIIVEDKRSSLSVHYRMIPWLEQALKTRIATIVARSGVKDVEIMHGKDVVEIKSTRFNKGEAVRVLMKSATFARRNPVFVGDDTTDASVFSVLAALGGIGYSVERSIPGAIWTFDSPTEVRHWLATLCGRHGRQ